MSQVEQFVQSWKSHRLVLNDLLDRVSDNDLGFQPWSESIPLGDLFLHIVQSSEMFANAAKNGSFGPRGDKLQASTVSELKEIVQGATERTTAVLNSMADADLSKMVDTKAMFGVDLPAIAMLTSMKDHEVHHKGQLFVYVRLLGVSEMPFFIHRNA